MWLGSPRLPTAATAGRHEAYPGFSGFTSVSASDVHPKIESEHYAQTAHPCFRFPRMTSPWLPEFFGRGARLTSLMVAS